MFSLFAVDIHEVSRRGSALCRGPWASKAIPISARALQLLHAPQPTPSRQVAIPLFFAIVIVMGVSI